jgi:hypothetical protein
VALPVLVGATALKGSRVAARLRHNPSASAQAVAAATGQAPSDPAGVAPLAAGAVAAFVSTLAALRVIGLRRERPLWPWAVERAALAAAVALRG